MALSPVFLGHVGRIESGATPKNVRDLTNLLELQITVVANYPEDVSATARSSIIEEFPRLQQYLGAALPAGATAELQTEWAKFQQILAAMQAIAGGSTLAQASSFLPLTGLLVGALVIAGGVYWYIKRGRRQP